jgi:ERCC4-type nuclease
MIVKIDCRETELIKSCKYILEISPAYKDIQIVVENLPLGDVIIENNGIEAVIIERKSLRDLAASIKDGRYEEQSYRLNGLHIHNHNILYLIEGDMNKFNVFKDRMEKLTLYSAMVSLNFYKGFSVMRTLNVDESALFICNMAHKIGKFTKDGKQPYYIPPFPPLGKVEPKTKSEINESLDPHLESESSDLPLESESSEGLAPPFSKVDKVDYCTVVKKVKKENVTPENIGEIMLCQIPGVSSTTAIALMEKFKSLPALVMELKENKDCLKDISYTNSKGQTRKLSKPALANIVKYLNGFSS